MNAETVFEKFLTRLAEIKSIEEKEYAMIEAYDDLDDTYSEAEKLMVWNRMLAAA